MDFIALDVETANGFMGSICQIGAVRFQAGKEVESISWLVDPQDDFDAFNVSIHGITEDRVRGSPCFRDRHRELQQLLKGSIVVTHTHFDRVSLMRACSSNGLPAVECDWLDSARIARRAWADVSKSGYGLANLANRFGINFRHHDATEDARAAGQIVLHAISETGIALTEWHARVDRYDAPDFRRAGGGEGVLLGESVVFTGALSITRSAAADRAHGMGAAVEAGVTKRTTIVVVGDQDLTKLAGQLKSAKHRKAEALIAKGQPIRILAERDFMSI